MHATSTPTLAQPKPNAFGAFVAAAALAVGIAAGAIAAVNLAPAAGTAVSNPAISTGAGLSIQRNGETGALSAAQRSLQEQRQGEIGAGAAAAAPAVQPADVMAKFNGLGRSVTPAVPALGGRDGTAYWNSYSLSGISAHDALRGSLGWYAFESAASAGNTQAAGTSHR
ncbi:MAG: hypothetical protein ABIQ58_09695 [Candidatus Limnocylindrales bacterium]